MRLKEFEVSNLITLRMENDITNIYIKGRLFRQCKFLLLNKLYPDEIKDYVEYFRSVDEEIENFDGRVGRPIILSKSPYVEVLGDVYKIFLDSIEEDLNNYNIDSKGCFGYVYKF